MARQLHDVPAAHTSVHRTARRLLETGQDLLVVGIALALFGLMFRTLLVLFAEITAPALNFGVVISQVLFMLVMVEVVRLLIVYLEEHRVAMDFMVELGIVATLREIILRGVLELDWHYVIAVSGFLLVLGALLKFGDLRPAGKPVRDQVDPTRNGRDLPVTANLA